MGMYRCDCVHGICTGYLPDNLKELRCDKVPTANTTKGCPCKHYKARPVEMSNQSPGCCDGENKTVGEAGELEQ